MYQYAIIFAKYLKGIVLEDLKIDKVFKKDIDKQFEFDEEVASVFDDMLDRSIPFYYEVLDLVSDLVVKNCTINDTVCDLGSSTATTLIEIYKKSGKDLRLIGIDNSNAMISRAKRKISAFGADIELIYADFIRDNIPASKIILANYTLQFVRPSKRLDLVQKIYDSLNNNGLFIFNEKVIYEDKKLHKQMIDEYHKYKRKKGYSDFEISKKREALENVLIPYSDDENISLLKTAGFKKIDIVFKWANFACFVAKK